MFNKKKIEPSLNVDQKIESLESQLRELKREKDWQQKDWVFKRGESYYSIWFPSMVTCGQHIIPLVVSNTVNDYDLENSKGLFMFKKKEDAEMLLSKIMALAEVEADRLYSTPSAE